MKASELQGVGQRVDHELVQLHQPDRRNTISYCRTCRDTSGAPELWPCPTLRIIRRLFRSIVQTGGRRA